MKSSNLLTKSLLLTVALGVASLAQAQIFVFDIDDINGHTNYTGVGASGTVDFTTNAYTEVSVSMTNDSAVSSYITGFYILKPMINTTLLEATGLLSYTDDGTKDWSLDDDKFGNVLNEFYQQGKDYVSLYFGAEVDNNPDQNGIFTGSTSNFTFAMDTSGMGLPDWLAYNDKGVGEGAVPHIFVRWQNVNNGDSAKGYDVWGDIPPPVIVPEPSEIAAMGLLGMLGLLWIRRRFINRKKK
ncbi:MAG: PEP-CTERM sorting domain-containing protein [Puniceicoccaceae bacterium]